MFLDVAQALDKVWHEGLKYKMSKIIPGNFSWLLETYLSDTKFCIQHEESKSEFYSTNVVVPQDSVLSPIL